MIKNIIIAINIVFVTLFLLTPKHVSAAILGDVNGDGRVNIIDIGVVIDNYGKSPLINLNADINKDSIVDILDIGVIIDNFAATPIKPVNVTNNGIWISTEEIMRLPMSGPAWGRVLSAANSNWGSVCLYDNNCTHDVNTLAGALVAVRMNDNVMRNKVITGLQAATKSDLSRALELSRGLQTYIIAADIIGYHDVGFENWVRQMLTVDIPGHSGNGVLGTALNSSNNWGGHARASVAAAAIYLNDANYKQKLLTAYKAFIGMPSVGNTLVYNDTNWHFDPNNKSGVNRIGSVRSGVNISGVLPEDWRRSAEYKWPPSTSGYMWEGMQGFVVTAVILHRAGMLPFNSGDNAVMRAMDVLYAKGEASLNNPIYINSASADDTWIPWVVNYYLKEKRYPTEVANPGKNMGWTDWTHQ